MKQKLTVKSVSCIWNDKIQINIKPKQKWMVEKVGDGYLMSRDCLTIRTTEKIINDIFDMHSERDALAKSILSNANIERTICF